MRSNIVLDEKLVDLAAELAGHETDRDLLREEFKAFNNNTCKAHARKMRK